MAGPDKAWKKKSTHPTEEKSTWDWALAGMFKPKVTPDGNVQLCGPPSHLWNESGVAEFDMTQVFSVGIT